MVRLGYIAVFLPFLAALPAAAQGLSSGGIAGGGFHPVTTAEPKVTRREAPPPGLPGSRPATPAPPSEALQLDVPPTEALFDAINRGDMASARDALNRGADLNGHNVLGMTPLDLSVDLSRNDITFLLLSMRSEAAVSGPPPVAQGKPAKVAASGKTTVAAKFKPQVPDTRKSTTTSNVATSPARYASVPATPAPQAGFLGFGETAVR